MMMNECKRSGKYTCAFNVFKNPSRLVLQSWCPFVLVVIPLCLTCSGQTLSHTRRLRHTKFCGKEVPSVLCSNTLCTACRVGSFFRPFVCSCVFCGCSEMCQQRARGLPTQSCQSLQVR